MSKKTDAFLAKKLDEAAAIRTGLAEVEWKRMGKLQELFELLFNKPRDHLRRVNDAYYYINGGYPNPDSDPRWMTAAKNLGAMFYYMNELGDPNVINDFLRKEFGIEMKVVEKRPLKLAETTPAKEAKIEKIKKDFKVPLKKGATAKEVLATLKNETGKVQKVICAQSNKIKRTIYKEVRDVTKVRRGDFQRTVSVRVAKLKSGRRADGRAKGIYADASNFVNLTTIAQEK